MSDEREAVAEILSLPDGPWDFAPGHATAASFFAAMEFAAEMNRRARGGRRYSKKSPGGAECKQV